MRCPKCSMTVSDMVYKCPKCGFFLQDDINNEKGKTKTDNLKIDKKKVLSVIVTALMCISAFFAIISSTILIQKNGSNSQGNGYISAESSGEESTIDIYVTEKKTTEKTTTQRATTQKTTTEKKTTEKKTTEKRTTEVVTTEVETTTVDKFGTKEDILEACNTQAVCETDFSKCRVDVNSSHNPYDVVWDYGEKYNSYVEACDWSLVWDYDFYVKTFPVLAELYHYDKDLLLEHFQTVGVHEGRQGSEKFNFYAFKMNSYCYNYENVYAAYYIDYMLNYDTYAYVNTSYLNDGNSTKLQYATILTAAQKQELHHVNMYREEVGEKELHIYGELTAFANLRGYINVHDNYYAHKWFEIDNFANAKKYGYLMDSHYLCISENCIEGSHYYSMLGATIFADMYRDSPDHYAAMISGEYSGIGISNVYFNMDLNRCCQFDAFIGNNSDGL